MSFADIAIPSRTTTRLPKRTPPKARPQAALDARMQAAREAARAWAHRLDQDARINAAAAFTAKAFLAYSTELQITPLPHPPLLFKLDFSAVHLASELGRCAAGLDPLAASYCLANTYSSLLPDPHRSAYGIYYTPPALAARLLDMAAAAGVDWSTCRVLDPACGGGAFLLPAALRIADALHGQSPRAIVRHIARHLRGFEIDPFAAWLSQATLVTALQLLVGNAAATLPPLVTVRDTLEAVPKPDEVADLVVGNPPFGRVTLSPPLRERYKRGLYGHANLYGVFTDLALRWTAASGIIAYVTPTSFLAGEYFKSLRSLLAAEAPPVAVDFVDARKGVFEDVLQETMLSTYRRGAAAGKAAVHFVTVASNGSATVKPAGDFQLPVNNRTAPWFLPRQPQHARIIEQLSSMGTSLADWGYSVSTGPLVWNRHKAQLRAKAGSDTLPLIWAESVAAPGVFLFRAAKKNHQPYFQLQPGDDWLRIEKPCILLQRTTAKEQSRRLISAELPRELIDTYGGAVIENHLNMIRPSILNPPVSQAAVSAFLNSQIADLSFRCMSGSVAVSAFELENLPVPSLAAMRDVERLVSQSAPQSEVDRHLNHLYANGEIR